jgi:AraC-like DNA-binding protein
VRLQSFDDDVSLEQINSIVNQLTKNIAQAPSMSEFAAQFGMTESRFSRFFRRATGNNFIDFVNRVRISRACLLLMESNRYITHICYDVGFNNVANFNRRFLEIKGMTPSEFRRHANRRFGA